MTQATYKRIEATLINLLEDLQILAGERVRPSNVSWQDVAGTASVNAQVLATLLMEARNGRHESFMTFPSPAECLEKAGTE